MKVRYFFSPAVRRVVSDGKFENANIRVHVLATLVRDGDLCIYMRLNDGFYATLKDVTADEAMYNYSESLSPEEVMS